MSSRRFIKIGDTLLNPNSIRRIWIYPKEFHIELNPRGTSGLIFMGSGLIGSDEDLIKVNKEKNPQTYQYLEKWIHKQL